MLLNLENENGYEDSILDLSGCSLPTPSTVNSDTPGSSLVSPILTDTDASSTDCNELYDSKSNDLSEPTPASPVDLGEEISSSLSELQAAQPQALMSPLKPVLLESALCPAPLRISNSTAATVHSSVSPEKPVGLIPLSLPPPPTCPLPQPPQLKTDVCNDEPLSFPQPPQRKTNLCTHKLLSLPRSTYSTTNSMSSFLLNRSLSRYNSQLTSLRPHIPAHIAAVEELISIAKFAQESRKRSTIHANTHDNNSDRNGSGLSATGPRPASFWSFKPSDVNNDERSRLEREERIERLRANGWKLGRGLGGRGFKGTEYYEELCEKALRELDELQRGRKDEVWS
jgi:hypothetical protein